MMSTPTISPELKSLAKDLTQDFPRSPRYALGGYVLAGRMVDKCRAVLNGTAGEYHYNCPLDRMILDFTGIDAEELKAFIASGASDEAVGEWIKSHSKVQNREEVVQWNNKLRDTRLSDLPPHLQVYMEDYIAEFVPAGKVVYHWFDVYDYEEKRL
jgi:hypothetical protein